MSFNDLGLSPTLLQAVHDTGYTTPTPIQLLAIPAILTGKDVMGAAQTGTGKTASFTLPLLQLLSGGQPAASNQVRALVLTPTRELAAQVQESIETYGKHEKLRSAVVFGGVNINPQQMALRKGVDILVATPGRLLDLYQQNAVKFNQLEILVLDEADRMLDMGFIRDIRKILQLLPKKRQNLMFSATFSDEIRTLAKTICHQPQEIDVAPRNSTVDAVEQQVYEVSKDKKLGLLGKLLQDTRDQVLVFSRTKHGANALVKKLAGYGVDSAAIHGNKSQSQRTKALADFKANKTQVLVATDIAARGIDIDLLAMVINFDMPQVPEDYVHRIGRTGRAGASGLAVSLVCEDDRDQLRAIERLIKRKITRMEFDVHNLPVAQAVAGKPDDSDDERKPQQRRQPQRRGSGDRSSQPQTGNRQPRDGNRQPRQDGAQASPRSRSQQPRRPQADGIGNSRSPQGQQTARAAGNRQQQSPSSHNRSAQRQDPNRPRQPGQNKPAPPPKDGNFNREGASFAEKANKKGDSGFWQKLRNGKLFNRS